jgi:aspartate beta-hydroxylase
MNPTDWPRIVAAMKSGGYYARVMAGGPELDRVKDYLRAFAGERGPAGSDPAQNPAYPCFPGLRHRAFHDPSGSRPVQVLESAWEAIREEALALDDDTQLDYTIASKPVRSLRRPWTLLKRRAPPRAWTVYPFWHMGVDVESVTRRCPRTMAVLRTLPGLCVEYPWGDAIFSVQGPHSRLPPHCSVDNLRLRCHLGLRIPPGTGIRVGPETRAWAEGKCLLFEDAFEHEVWNHSGERRIVLIADFWHPDLTPAETRALTAGFMKREVREIFLAQRIRMTNHPETYLPHLEASIREQEGCALVREFWNA